MSVNHKHSHKYIRYIRTPPSHTTHTRTNHYFNRCASNARQCVPLSSIHYYQHYWSSVYIQLWANKLSNSAHFFLSLPLSIRRYICMLYNVYTYINNNAFNENRVIARFRVCSEINWSLCDKSSPPPHARTLAHLEKVMWFSHVFSIVAIDITHHVFDLHIWCG